MSDEYNRTSGGYEAREGHQGFAYSISYADKAEESEQALAFPADDTPHENDLLPDEEYSTEIVYADRPGAAEYDIAVIGGGPVGQCAAISASKLGAKVIMFEREALGGKWLNCGCIPSKVYPHCGNDDADLQRSVELKKSIVSKITSDFTHKLRSCRIRVEAGEASLRGPHEIFCNGRLYNVSKVILCGGCRPDPLLVPGAAHDGVCDTKGLFRMQDVPPRLMIMGGDSEGCEIALAYASYGSNVMIVEPGEKLLPGWDAQVAGCVTDALTDAGVKIHTGITVNEIQDREGKPFVITNRGGVLCDKLLVFAEKKSDTSSLGNMAEQIEVDRNIITVNEYLETTVPGIYAAGSITGIGNSTQAGFRMAQTAAANAMGKKAVFNQDAAPVAILTVPEAASVGLTEEEALEKYGSELVIGTAQLSSNVRAMLSGNAEGFVKVLAGRRYGEIYGVHIVAAEAAEMISEPSAMMRMEITIHEAANDIFHVHPTYSEAFAEACADAVSKISDRRV